MTAVTNEASPTRLAMATGTRNPRWCSRDKPPHERSLRAMSLGEDNTRWAFIKKLMAIEEEHDRRKRERERQKEVDMEAVTAVVTCEAESAVTQAGANDSLSRWLDSQVLDDNPEDNHIQDNLFTNKSLNRTKCLPLLTDQDNEESETDDSLETRSWASLPSLSTTASIHDDEICSPRPKKKRQLRLPPILLPRIYAVAPRPLKYREFLTPTTVRGPITDEEWEDLRYCRYIRHAVPKFAMQLSSSNLSSSVQF